MRISVCLMLCLLALPLSWCAASEEQNAAQIEFFEKHVRPLLVERCQSCHGVDEQEGSLRLDSRHGLLEGGDTGPAIVPGKPEESELVLAISYDPDGYQMPPDGKLSDEEIGILKQWIANGAIWPGGDEPVEAAKEGFDPSSPDHWSLYPPKMPEVPPASQPEWSQHPIDAFVLRKLEEADLSPSEPTSRELLLRRATFDLTGLPPTAEQRERFLNSDDPQAYEELIAELLASPRYGEHWGRHWLDLVRYAETMGHEFDYLINDAWRYRDYVIRALNDDIPYDQFAREHIAGDLLAEPRFNSETGLNESILATGFYWFGQAKHSPVDIRAEQCDLFDNQIDVLTKTFLGLTVACARCHDHKFDPIPTRDYYAMAGILESSRRSYVDLRDAAALDATVERMLQLKDDHKAKVLDHAITQLRNTTPADLEGFAIADPAAKDLSQPWTVWKRLASLNDGKQFNNAREKLLRQLRQHNAACADYEKQSTVYENFQAGIPTSWIPQGQSFAATGDRVDFLFSADPWHPLERIVPRHQVHSGTASGMTYGVLRTPTFVIDKPFIDYHVSRTNGNRLTEVRHDGRLKDGQIHLIIDCFQQARAPIYGQLSLKIEASGKPHWKRQDVSKWIGHRAYIEFMDEDRGHLAVNEVRFSEGQQPASPAHEKLIALLDNPAIDSPATFRAAFAELVSNSLEDVRTMETGGRQPDELAIDLVNGLLDQQQTGDMTQPRPEWLDALYVERTSLEKQLETPVLGIAMVDGSPIDSPLLIRGNPGKPSDEVPRQFLSVLGSTPEDIPADQSGRLQLAEAITSPENPLFDRVIVNRIWKHHFGRGLVPTPDDFGRMGTPPSHPELLDWLAIRFRENGRSLKWLHRELMTTATYQMSSDIRPDCQEADPQNVLLHRMPVRRLGAEAIRDSMLAVAGTLDETQFGPPVPTYLTPFMQGRGRPKASGPLNGNNRRSIYLEVRRNFLSPMFLAFDYPLPLTTTGRRSVSNVPAQALVMMNNDFAWLQADLWATHILSQSELSIEERITQLYLTAYSRKPTEVEVTTGREFLNGELAAGRAEREVWQDYCQVLMNAKEFMFIR